MIDTGIPEEVMTCRQFRSTNHHDLVLEDISENISVPLTGHDLDLLTSKISICQNICDFKNILADVKAKEIKQRTLIELDSLLSTPEFFKSVPEYLKHSLISMISANIFRDIVNIDREFIISPESPLLVDVAWPHLKLCYSILLKCQNTPYTFTREFVKRMTANLAVPGFDEQTAVLTFLERYTAVHKSDIDWILADLYSMVLSYREGVKYPFVVSPILSFLSARFKEINEKQPSDVFGRILLSVIGAPHFTWFWRSFKGILRMFSGKEGMLSKALFKATIRTWPKSCGTTEARYVKLMKLLVEKARANVQVKALDILMSCARSPNARVAEASFKVWRSSTFIERMQNSLPMVKTALLPVIRKCSEIHWSHRTRLAAVEAASILQDITTMVHVKNAQTTSVSLVDSHRMWALIARTAAKMDSTIPLGQCLANIQVKFTELITEDDTIL